MNSSAQKRKNLTTTIDKNDIESSVCKKVKVDNNLLAYLTAKDNDGEEKEILKSLRMLSLPLIDEETIQLLKSYFETGM